MPQRRAADAEATGLALLQRQVGNRAVLAMLGAQARLSVGSVDDPLEAEADRTAAQVVEALRTASAAGQVTRSRADDEDWEPAAVARTIHRMPASSAAVIGAEGGDLDGELESRLGSARSGGSPLPPGVLRSMEGAFGADFSGVRIHEGPTAAGLSQELGATAFTVGRDIFFRGAAPNPSSGEGQHLLAHELAHTVQQGASPIRPLEEL